MILQNISGTSRITLKKLNRYIQIQFKVGLSSLFVMSIQIFKDQNQFNSYEFEFLLTNTIHTGKSFSEALILASVAQYDKRLFMEFPEKNKFTTWCVQKLFFCFDIQSNICTQHVVYLYFLGNLMNNLSSYCKLTDSRMRASDTDLPVQ